MPRPPIEDASPAGFMTIFPSLMRLARELGYNLMPHGSMRHDYDMVAIAWTHSAVSAQELVEAFRKKTGGKIQDSEDCDPFDFTRRAAEPKPHGRFAYTIHLMGGPMIDLSVIGPEPDSIIKSGERLDVSVMGFLRKRVDKLEAENKSLRSQLQKLKDQNALEPPLDGS